MQRHSKFPRSLKQAAREFHIHCYSPKYTSHTLNGINLQLEVDNLLIIYYFYPKNIKLWMEVLDYGF